MKLSNSSLATSVEEVKEPNSTDQEVRGIFKLRAVETDMDSEGQEVCKLWINWLCLYCSINGESSVFPR